ncbi:MAG: 3-deoxy-8-phosphooctulonate synthase [Deltaproteobacteria bacterium]|nr:3-deoxy-8-phosphooctulonate synthase [Deltaproteobacteria bacterium]
MQIGGVRLGRGAPLALIAGPCVVEDEATLFAAAEALASLRDAHGLAVIFKSSYEKDNRTSASAYRGPGLAAGLSLLRAVRERFGLPVLADVHRAEDVASAAEALDAVQVPALLSRQTSFLETVAACGRPVVLKKGQFLSARGVAGALEKLRGAGAREVLVVERGSCFGYDRLVVDFGALDELRGLGCPVALDAGHPAPKRDSIPTLARAGVAAGVDALFVECHPDPGRALCDGERMLSLHVLAEELPVWLRVAAVVRGGGASVGSGALAGSSSLP